jgi:hypothetical protein
MAKGLLWYLTPQSLAGHGFRQVKKRIAMKKASMLLALSFALSAPVGAVAIALIAATTAVMRVHPQQAFAKLQHLRLPRHG